MPTYWYQGYDRRSDVIAPDYYTTDSEAALREHLTRRQIDLIDWKVLPAARVDDASLPLDELLDLFSTLRGTRYAGLADAVSSHARVSRNAAFTRVLRGVADVLKSGVPFPDALAQYPQVFPEWLVAIVRSGFNANEIGRAYEQAYDALRRRLSRKRTFESFMGEVRLVAGLASLFVLLYLYVLGPRLAAGAIASSHSGRWAVRQGILTHILLHLVWFTHNPIFLVVAILAIGAYFLARYVARTNAQLQRRYERYELLHTGEYGRILLTEHAAMVCEQLAVLLPNLSREETFDMISRTSAYRMLADEWQNAAALSIKGASLSEAVDRVEHLDPRVYTAVFTTRHLPLTIPPGASDEARREWTVSTALQELSTRLFESVEDRTQRFITKASLRWRLGLIGAFIAISLVFMGPYIDAIWSQLQFHP